MQEMITAARKLRADHGLDKKLLLEGILYCRNGSRNVELPVIEKLATVRLDVRTGAAPDLNGAVRSTPEFDLVLRLPEVDLGLQRTRLTKEIEQLEKAIGDKDRQLASEKFLASAPSHIVESLRAKRSEQAAQLEKSRATLNTLP
jgi:valyl-tRNA synthetase